MVHDIEQFDSNPMTSSFLDWEFSIGSFKDAYGYPDPRFTAQEQRSRALYDGVEPPLSKERMATNIYYYERQQREADAGQPMPSFEEHYGYPDPRQQQPNSSELPPTTEQ